MINTKRPRFRQGKFIPDPTLLSFMPDIDLSLVNDDSVSDKFLDTYRSWILSTKNNSLSGLSSFPFAAFSQGTTESFDKFYIRHSRRVFRVFRGEYAYHKIMFKSGLDWSFIEDSPLNKNDALIISIPFANSGNAHKYQEILKEASLLDIPVLVDCCWFGTCGDLDIDLTYPCIREVTFCLSKTFPVSRFRIGIRFSKEDYEDDGLFAYKKDKYINFFSQHLGIRYMSNFSSDYLFEKYREKQLSLCSELGVTPSNVVSLATSPDENWKYLLRGDPHNFRLCLSDELI